MMIDIRQEYENNVNKIKSVKDIKHVVGKLEGGSTSKGSIYVYFFFFLIVINGEYYEIFFCVLTLN